MLDGDEGPAAVLPPPNVILDNNGNIKLEGAAQPEPRRRERRNRDAERPRWRRNPDGRLTRDRNNSPLDLEAPQLTWAERRQYALTLGPMTAPATASRLSRKKLK